MNRKLIVTVFVDLPFHLPGGFEVFWVGKAAVILAVKMGVATRPMVLRSVLATSPDAPTSLAGECSVVGSVTDSSGVHLLWFEPADLDG